MHILQKVKLASTKHEENYVLRFSYFFFKKFLEFVRAKNKHFESENFHIFFSVLNCFIFIHTTAKSKMVQIKMVVSIENGVTRIIIKIKIGFFKGYMILHKTTT